MTGKFTRPILIVLLVLVCLGGTLSGYLYYQLSRSVPETTLFEIPPGSHLSGIAQRLTGEGILPTDNIVFKAVALMTRGAGPIKAGQYELTQGMRSLDLLALFRSGKVVQHRITFPEGLTESQWQQRLSEAPFLKRETAGLSSTELAERMGVPNSLEGWLFPDTYHYVLGDSDLDVLQFAVARMQSVLDQEWAARGITGTLENPYDALILASIVEKETGFGPDREKIASVFLNRLARGMKLQSDPTVIYGLGAEFDGDLKRVHLKSDTPYNSYTRPGLPPTPICSPGLASIKAALSGASHPYLYFVAMGDGKSYFSTSLEEHNDAVNRYQKKQR